MLVQEEDVVKLCDAQSFNFLCKVIEIAALLKEITKPLLLFTLCTIISVMKNLVQTTHHQSL